MNYDQLVFAMSERKDGSKYSAGNKTIVYVTNKRNALNALESGFNLLAPELFFLTLHTLYIKCE